MHKTKPPCILYFASFPPRECGIATFTQDLTNAIDKEFNPGVKSKILAINANGTSIYNYPRKVTFQINETEMEDYINRANEINKSPEIKLVNIQHEFGLYGGEQGEYLLPFLALLKKPIVLTMHTVLPHPEEKMKKVAQAMADKVEAITVMNKTAKAILHEIYNVPKNKITVIPHGVHHIPFPSKSRAKKKLNLSSHIVLSTFGMMSCDKGIEYAIEALPEIVREYPNILYLIIGATHPEILKKEGEKYRNKLKRLVVKHKLEDNVKFYNRYLELSELIDYLKATDIYIYPMLSKEQASSGSLSYAMSCACPIITTGSQYAKSVINRERGRIVRFRNSRDIAKALEEFLADKQLRKEMKKNNYFYSRHMTWQNVALSYFKLFNKFAKILPQEKDKIPCINLDHVKALTDDFGMIQFANHTKPDIHSGYCLDDNARALIACAMQYKHKRFKVINRMMHTYICFIKYAQKTNGKFINFINYNKKFLEGESEDSFGRAIWSLGYVLSRDYIDDKIKKKAKVIFKKAIKNAGSLKSPRAIAFTVIGLSYFQDSTEKINLIRRLADKLIRRYKATIKKDSSWQWFEEYLTYANFKLPEALFRAYQAAKQKEYKNIAEAAMKFIINITFEKKDYFSPIGQDGWYFRDGKRAYFDQQPEDTASAVEALITAYQITKKKLYLHKAKLAFEWFLGKNHLNQMIYDEATGGCYDGLGKYSINFNQGAESTISYLLARLAMEDIK